MANVSDTGDCGCSQPARRHEQVLAGQVVGDQWKDIVHDLLMKDAAEKARRRAAAGDYSADEPVVVKTPLTLYVNFPRDKEIESANAEVSCSCTITIDETGEVCVCVGACDFPACCNGDPVKTKQ
jgi:hypothetical protein